MLRSLTRRDVSILICNLLDHFDAGLYGFLVPILAPLFFPDHDYVVQLILAYSVLATSLVTRPIGAILFSIMARRSGPVYALSYSLWGLAISTACMGMIPLYDTIGWWSAFLLVLLRGISGVFAAGEAAVAQLYLLNRKGYQDGLKAGQYYHTSSMVGTVLSSFAATVAIIWGGEMAWRICFLTGSLAGFSGVILRFSASNEPVKMKKAALWLYSRVSFVSVFLKWKNIFLMAVISGFSYMTYAVPCIFMNSYVPMISSHSLEVMMGLNTAFLVIDLILIPSLGHLTRNFDPTKVMILASLTLLLTCPILFFYLENSSLYYVSFVRLWIIFWGVVFLCPISLWYKGLAGRSNGYLILGIAQALGTSTIGRMTPSIGFWFYEQIPTVFSPALWVSVCGLLVFWVLKKNPIQIEKRHKTHSNIFKNADSA